MEHGKLFVIDNNVAAFGSYNMEKSAHDRLAEGLMLTKDSDLIGAVRDSLLETMSKRSMYLLVLCQ